MRVKRATRAARAEPPHVPHELVLREHALRISGQVDQERELLCGEVERLPGDACRAPHRVDLQLAEIDEAAIRTLLAQARAPQHGLHAREQLPIVKWLAKHVVAPVLEKARTH